MLKKTLGLVLLLLISICFGEDILETSKQSRDVPRELNYQGYLTDTLGVPIIDDLFMTFKIFDARSGGNELWSETQSDDVPIESGVFSVILGETTLIPDSVFTDFTNTWLELTLDGSQTLTPRTRITSVGYAYTSTYSDTAEYAKNAAADNDWTINGNILYPAADYGLAMRSSNMLYGDSAHTHVNFGVACTTGASGQDYEFCTVGGGTKNLAGNYFATVSGGYDNAATGYAASIGGGYYNTASGSQSTVAGGGSHTAGGSFAVISGGRLNTTNAQGATVSGGVANYAAGYQSTVGGGYWDSTYAVYGGVFSGYSNLAGDEDTDTGTVVVGGVDNAATGSYSFIGSGENNSIVDYDYSVICGGFANAVSASYSTVCGGDSITVSGGGAVAVGGYRNTASGSVSSIGGGYMNIAAGNSAAVAGGQLNYAGGVASSIPGGVADSALANHSFATNYSTRVDNTHNFSAAFTTSHTTNVNQVRAAAFSTGTLIFTMDHPSDPMNKILNQHAIGSSEAMLIYSGSIVLDANGRATVDLPDYFDDINKNPRIQLTGVGTSDVYVAEDITENRFIIGGKPNTKVYWEVTGERTDIHAEIARVQTPVEQQKTGDLIGHSLDDDALIGIYDGLHQKRPDIFNFKTEEGRRVHEQSKHTVEYRE